MIRRVFVAIAALLMFCQVQPVFSQSAEEFNALKDEVKTLKAGQQAIQRDIQELKKFLTARQAQGGQQAPPPFKEAMVSIAGAPFEGDKNAKIALIEFSDYQCSFCARHVRDTEPQIKRDYISTGKVRHFLRNFPLPFHKQAFKAAEAADCAGDQGKFWEMHNRLFANQRALSEKELSEHAEALGLDMTKFEKCLNSGKYSENIKKDMEDGRRIGISGTPSFLLGFIEPDGTKVKAVKKIAGAQPYAVFKEAIDELLKEKAKAK